MSRIEKMKHLLSETPEDVFLNYAYGMELFKESQIEEAIAAFAKVRQLDSNYVPAYFQQGQMLAQDGRIEEAQAILEEGIQIARKTGDDHALGEMTEYLETL